MLWASSAMDLFWRNALAAIPLVLVVAAICRFVPCRPTTRHALWAMVLIWLIVPPLLPGLSVPESTATLSASAAAAVEDGKPLELHDAPSVAPEAEPAVPRFAESRRDAPRRLRELDTNEFGTNPSCPETDRSPPGRDSSRMVAPARSRSQETLVPSSGSRGLPSRVPAWRAEPEHNVSAAAEVTGTCASPSHPLRWLTSRYEKVVGAVSRFARRQVEAAKESQRLADARRESSRSRADQSILMYFDGAAMSRGTDLRKFDDTALTRADAPADLPLAAPVSAGVEPDSDPAPAEPSVVMAWLAGLARLRDAFAALPRLPSPVWLGGIALVLATYVFRAVSFHRHVRSATDAPAAVQRLVAKTARRVGLRRVPRAMMTDEGIGPMVWCGRRTRLLLPRELWSQLDGTGQKAILCHELAHLRRRDHWICRGELVVAALYWWHPLVWWVRRRLHEEAEFCCDAWVTWLMPGHRRAYAEALLHTKQYLSCQTNAAPVAGIGILTGRASRLARRITMVMTGSARPRLSVPGVALVAALAVTGWLASPAQSCPSEKDKAKAVGVSAKHKCTADHKHEDCKKKCTEEHKHGIGQHAEAKTTYEQYLTTRGKGGDTLYVTDPAHGAAYQAYVLASGDDDEHDAHSYYRQIEASDLEKRIERLERLIEEKLSALDTGSVTRRQRTERRTTRVPRTRRGATPAWPAPAAKPAPSAQPAPPAMRAPKAPPLGGSGWTTTPEIDDGCEKVTLPYELSSGNLKGLTELMIRPDVPILVRPGGEKIEVIGTKAQQAIFRSFAQMIDGDKETKKLAYRLSEGKLDALTELMSRSDVPTLITRSGDQIIVHGNDAEQAVFHSFVEMIDPKGGPVASAIGSSSKAKQAQERAMKAEARAHEHALQAELKGMQRAEQGEMRAEQRAHQAEVRAHERAMKAEKKAKERAKKRQKAGRRIEKASSGAKGGCSVDATQRHDLTVLLDHASGVLSEYDAQLLSSKLVALSDRDQLISLIKDAEGHAVELEQAKGWLFSRARQLEANAKTLSIQAAAAERQADSVRAQVEALEAQAERAEAEAEIIEYQAQEVQEQAAAGVIKDERAAREATLFVAQAKQLDAEARQIETQAAALEVEADQIDDQASQFDVKAEALVELVGLIVKAIDTVEVSLDEASGA